MWSAYSLRLQVSSCQITKSGDRCTAGCLVQSLYPFNNLFRPNFPALSLPTSKGQRSVCNIPKCLRQQPESFHTIARTCCEVLSSYSQQASTGRSPTLFNVIPAT